MPFNDDDFINSTVRDIKTVAREHAVQAKGRNEPFTVTITNNDIRQATDRERVKTPVLEKIHTGFIAAGLDAEINYEDKLIKVTVEPIVKSAYSLNQLKEAANTIDEIYLRESLED
ncbi:MAG: hypothetical protein EOO69_12505 [Moraxellaceae bacterium]|nr:MAG: hypothetical protein EOO69_12505 [Moraxellaceae bacterium]